MNRRLNALAIRRRFLIDQAAEQRAQLSAHMGPVKAVCAVGDKGLAAVRYLRQHPLLVAGGVGFAIALRPRRAFAWLRRGWMVWRLVGRLRRTVVGN